MAVEDPAVQEIETLWGHPELGDTFGIIWPLPRLSLRDLFCRREAPTHQPRTFGTVVAELVKMGAVMFDVDTDAPESGRHVCELTLRGFSFETVRATARTPTAAGLRTLIEAMYALKRITGFRAGHLPPSIDEL